MTAFNQWTSSNFKHQQADATTSRALRKRGDAKALKDAYKAVDARDKGVCVVTGTKTVKGAAEDVVRRERHHLKGRNVMPEWVNEPDRIVTVTAQAHNLITLGKILVEGDNATKPLRFTWAPDVPAKERVLKIRSRRKSQREAD